MESRLITVATCNLNQWALDFDGNCARVLESCRKAKAAGASYRLGPELELSGYGCEDHFYELDTVDHCWESLGTLFREGATDGLLCDFGMPCIWKGTRYNCRILAWNRKILLIRPKTALADDGNYRESRYFTPFRGVAGVTHPLVLPTPLASEFGQTTAAFGLSYLRTAGGLALGCESCEELWTPKATHIDLALQGVEIIGNGSGSYHSLRKLNQRLELVVAATRKCGGIYLYANQRGCDGGRLYFDGGAVIACNGRILAKASQFGLEDVEVITATVNVDEVRSYRASIPSFGMQASALPVGEPVDELSLNLFGPFTTRMASPTSSIEITIHSPQEECCLGPACWLWDYLRRSGAGGFLLPLSGGADSTAVATIVGAMCVQVTKHAQSQPHSLVAQDCRRLCRQEETPDWAPSTPQELAQYIMHTVYLGTENSSQLTTNRAKRVGEAIGSYHMSVTIDAMVQAVLKVFTTAFGKPPRFAVHGGSLAEDLALQNIQARLRMVTAYLLAQLVPWVRGRSGFLLVLGSANVDEGLRGYLTKYDCSSADLNPIGAISKGDLKKMLVWAAQTYGWEVLTEVAGAPPTAELRPNAAGDVELEHSQLDEDEMGMSYEELGVYGKLRKIGRCGPVSMYRELAFLWQHLSPAAVAEKVKHFFVYYSRNRHKMCTITPAYHAEGYSPDDNRFDLRPFLYPTRWIRQFRVIDQLVSQASTETKTQ
jgi:NAD+ synthase (glutamine-hydrolysing)